MHRFGREEAFSNRYDGRAMDMSNCDLSISDLPSIESEESAAKRNWEGQGLKILIPNKMVSRLSVTLAQIQAENNSDKLKNKIRQLLYFLNLSKITNVTIFMNTENSKTNESYCSRLILSYKINLRDPSKNMASVNLGIYNTLKKH